MLGKSCRLISPSGRPETRPCTRGHRSPQGPRPGGRACAAGRSAPGKPRAVGHRPVGDGPGAPKASSSARRPGRRRSTGGSPAPPGAGARRARIRGTPGVDRPGMEPVGTEIDRDGRAGGGDGTAAEPRAGLQHGDRQAAGEEPARRADPGGAGADHRDVGLVRQGREGRDGGGAQVLVGCARHVRSLPLAGSVPAAAAIPSSQRVSARGSSPGRGSRPGCGCRARGWNGPPRGRRSRRRSCRGSAARRCGRRSGPARPTVGEDERGARLALGHRPDDLAQARARNGKVRRHRIGRASGQISGAQASASLRDGTRRSDATSTGPRSGGPNRAIQTSSMPPGSSPRATARAPAARTARRRARTESATARPITVQPFAGPEERRQTRYGVSGTGIGSSPGGVISPRPRRSATLRASPGFAGGAQATM